LIAHSIDAAKLTSQIDETYVSTDDPEIAELGRRCGARVIERPLELASDTASSESALSHAIESITRSAGEPRLVVFLQATSPLRDDNDLASALDAFESQHADSMFSATRAHAFMWRLADGARPLNYDPRARPRRQDAPTDVLENGSFYIFKPSVLRETGSRLGGKIAVHMMRAATSFQIDEPDDLALMEWLFSKHRPVASSTVFQANFATLSAMAREVATTLEPVVTAAGDVLASAIAGGGKILACGNGGSAADAQHFVAELVGRLKVERRALPGISLSSDPSVVTCLANDYGYDQLFSRQVEAFGAPGDALLAISTSGKSPNVLNAARAARQIGMPVVSLIGSHGDQLAELSDHCVRIPTGDTQCIQELHMVVLHILCASIDQRIVG
jgi:N-acylneuraminate cytidylyltransferase